MLFSLPSEQPTKLFAVKMYKRCSPLFSDLLLFVREPRRLNQTLLPRTAGAPCSTASVFDVARRSCLKLSLQVIRQVTGVNVKKYTRHHQKPIREPLLQAAEITVCFDIFHHVCLFFYWFESIARHFSVTGPY